MRSYAVKEDRAELGKRTGVRYTAKRLDPKKGSATAYIAKYISKNIDGYALDGEMIKWWVFKRGLRLLSDPAINAGCFASSVMRLRGRAHTTRQLHRALGLP